MIIKTIASQARVHIGRDSGLSSATISSAYSIEIGERVLIGAGVLVTDSDHHYVDIWPVTERRCAGVPDPRESDGVQIGSDVFIGSRTIVLKGTRIGEGSVIGAGSVVSGYIPEHVVAAGNPCRVVRHLKGA